MRKGWGVRVYAYHNNNTNNNNNSNHVELERWLFSSM
jgi:hypothetical protein